MKKLDKLRSTTWEAAMMAIGFVTLGYTADLATGSLRRLAVAVDGLGIDIEEEDPEDDG